MVVGILIGRLLGRHYSRSCDMTEDLVDNLHAIRQSDAIIGRLWFGAVTRRLGFLALAGLIGIFGLGMTNAAGFYALLESEGPVWAAGIVAAMDFALAAIVMLASRRVKPDPEIEQAFDARKMAMESIRADVSDLKAAADAFVQDIRDAKDSILEFAHDPLDSAVQKLLIPAATSIINGLRTKKDDAA
jgi:hypothetical protein